MAQWVENLTAAAPVAAEVWIPSLPWYSGLKDPSSCPSCSVGHRCSLRSTPGPGTSICCRCSQKRKKKKKERKEGREKEKERKKEGKEKKERKEGSMQSSEKSKVQKFIR